MKKHLSGLLTGLLALLVLSSLTVFTVDQRQQAIVFQLGEIFFSPVSVYETKDGYAYIAVGNDKQWETMTKIPGFESLYKKEYERNAGRIADVDNLNNVINAITKKFTTEQMIDIFTKATIAISKVNPIEEVVQDPLVKPNLLRSQDPKTGVEITIAPPPINNSYLKSINRMLSFPLRFGEHNEEIYSGLFGYSCSIKGV